MTTPTTAQKRNVYYQFGRVDQVEAKTGYWNLEVKDIDQQLVHFRLNSGSGVSAPSAEDDILIAYILEDSLRVIVAFGEPSVYAPGSPGDPPPTSPFDLACPC